MLEISNLKDLQRLRRLALHGQGLVNAKTFGSGEQGCINAICHVGYIQIDSISVVERAHHHVLYSRVPKYSPSMLNEMLKQRLIFEYWAHAAAFLPIGNFRFSLPYKHAIKSGVTHWYKNPDKKLMSEILTRVRSDGPLRARDLESASKTSRGGWWDWKPAKKAIEQLYMQGDLMVCDREGFQKSYDLTERVLPSNINTHAPSVEEFAEHLLEQSLRCHIFVSLKSITYLRKNTELRKAVKALVLEKLQRKELIQLRLNNGAEFIAAPKYMDISLPRQSNKVLFLSPFDNSLIQRERLKALFDFDYQLECYVPEAKRQYGYFCLPILYRDSFVGRADCKAHRDKGELEFKSVYLDFENLQLENIDEDAFAATFAKAARAFAKFQACDSLCISQVSPQRLLKKLRSLL